jgi:hypothetical protein
LDQPGRGVRRAAGREHPLPARDDRRLGHLDLRIHRRRSRPFARFADAEDEHLLAAVVEGNILPGLEETQFADALSGNPAGGEVGHAAGLELQTNVGDVGLAGKNGQTHGANFLHRRFHQPEHDVEIVNHEIENHVLIERTWSENAQPVNFKKHGLSDERRGGPDGRIEAFQVPDLADAI